MRLPMHGRRPTIRCGFTLVELIIVVAILGLLAGLLAPAVAKALEIADQTACASNLHQLAVAMNLYLKDNDGMFFPIRENRPDGVLWYFGYESHGSPSRGEGMRILDRTRGKLYPYLGLSQDVEVCPAFNYDGPYKPKYQGKWWTYGVNAELAGLPTCRSIDEVQGRDASRTVIFADSAWVNTFQAPASPQNPLVEEWFYVQPQMRYVHFRHGGLANVLFADWHVEACPPKQGSYDRRLPSARIGCLDGRDVLFRPRR